MALIVLRVLWEPISDVGGGGDKGVGVGKVWHRYRDGFGIMAGYN